MTRSRVAPVIIVLMLAGARLYDEADATGRVTLVKHFTPADRESGRYQYVPFDVLPGAQRLTISYDYDKANGENTIDLGLFEPGFARDRHAGVPRLQRRREDLGDDHGRRGHARVSSRPHSAGPLASAARPVPRARRRRGRLDHDRDGRQRPAGTHAPPHPSHLAHRRAPVALRAPAHPPNPEHAADTQRRPGHPAGPVPARLGAGIWARSTPTPSTATAR